MSVRRHTEKLVAMLRQASPEVPIFPNAIGPENDPTPEVAFVYIETNALRAQNFQGSVAGGTVFRVQAHAGNYTACIALTEAVEQVASEVRPKALIMASQGGYNKELRLHIRELTVHIR